ncbi:MAG: response regulator transcription factor [Erysipelotrichales bacterium]|nr:response regulator transcription factor [Erysipelotrichales bacterium]
MRILLAEDERMLSEAITAILNRGNYSVDAVFNGQDALGYLDSDQYDAVILDIMMPKVDGITVLKTLRAEGKDIPVLLLTSKSEIDDKIQGLDSGADDYLTKPFDARELLARIRAITRRAPEVQNNDLSFGNLTLNRTAFELSGPEGSVRLANKEFQMMEMFMRYPGQVISAERFMEKIWGYDSDSEINVVWVNISGLRKKIAQVGASAEIKALRGAGYLLEEKS